jgi:hypothetical protein
MNGEFGPRLKSPITIVENLPIRNQNDTLQILYYLESRRMGYVLFNIKRHLQWRIVAHPVLLFVVVLFLNGKFNEIFLAPIDPRPHAFVKEH